jgi:uncharacterized protein (DUF433 family)
LQVLVLEWPPCTVGTGPHLPDLSPFSQLRHLVFSGRPVVYHDHKNVQVEGILDMVRPVAATLQVLELAELPHLSEAAVQAALEAALPGLQDLQLCLECGDFLAE